MVELLLNGQWQMKAIHNDTWMTTSVPGSVMTTLLEHDKIDDPFYRDNEDQSREILKHDYEYMRDFEVPSELMRQDHIVLRCEGLDTLSHIFINNDKVASTDNMHRTYELDIKPFIKEGHNTIHITFNSPIAYIEEKHAEQPLDGVEHAMEGYQYMRKAHSMFGWDWGPKIPDIGIWRDMMIVGWEDTRIADVYVHQDHQSDCVDLNVHVKVDKSNDDSLDFEVAITSPSGERIQQQLKSEDAKEAINLTIDQPQLWWPNGYGDQALYHVEVIVKSNNNTLDAHSFNIGLRTIDIRHEPDEWGKSFEFIVNGIAIFGMGANYIPEDSLLPRTSRKRTERLIKDSVEANFNMIRIWGGGYYPDDYFYDLCDQYGLIVWQDFMFACSVYDLTPKFEETIRQEVIDNMRRIRHHASLGLWCGNNEVEEGWEHWGWPKRSKFRTHYLKLFEIVLPELVEKYDPQTFYWPSSPSSGGAFDRPRDPNIGDVHFWEVWHGLKPFTEYRKFHFRFCSEFGFQSFPSLKTIKTFTKPEDRNIFSYVMEKHQKNDGANGTILTYLSDTFLYPKDFDSLLYTSQLLQGEAIKYGVEHWRRNRGISMGSIYWQLNDCWPVASWSSIDYFGRWKALHYFAKRFYAPVLLSIKEEGTGAELHVTNETRESVAATVVWKLRSNDGEVLKSGQVTQDIEPLTADKLESLSFADVLVGDQKRETYLEAVLQLDGKVDSSTTVLFTQPKHFTFLDPTLECDVKEEADQFVVTVTADAFAKYVALDLKTADCKFSDNYFDVSPGTPKTVTVSKDSLTEALDLNAFRDQLKQRSLYDISE